MHLFLNQKFQCSLGRRNYEGKGVELCLRMKGFRQFKFYLVHGLPQTDSSPDNIF